MQTLTEGDSVKALSGGTAVARGLQLAYWLTLFLVFPLTIVPNTTEASMTVEDWILLPKAAVLGIALTLAILAVMVTYSDSTLRKAGAYFRHLPLSMKGIVLLIPLTFIFEAINSNDFAVTAIGSAGRVDGALVQMAWLGLALGSFYLVKRSLVPLRMVAGLFVLGTLLVGLWGGLQVMRVEPLNFLGLHLIADGTPRTTLGHRALATCLIAMGLVVPMIWLSLRNQYAPILILLCAMMSGLLVAAEGRAGMVGAFVAWSMLGAILLFRRSRLTGFIVVTLSMVIGAGTVALLKPGGTRQLTSIAAASQGSDGSFEARYAYYWPIAIKAIEEKPLLGWGIEGFSSAFWSLSSPEEQYWVVRNHISRVSYPEVRLSGTPVQFVKRSRLASEEIRIFTVDRAHNWYLDTAFSFGLPYTALLLVVLVTWGVGILRSRSVLALSLGGACVVYLVFSLAWFATLPLTPLFWALVGASSAIVLRASTTSRQI